MKHITLAYSSCPNDTFIFHALAHGLLKTKRCVTDNKETTKSDITENIEFDITIADVETLNKNAANSLFDVTKLSFATFGALRDKYALLRSGAALGRGCGPLVISLPDKEIIKSPTSMIERPVIAVPGRGTTASVLFTLFLKQNFPEIKPNIVPMPFDKIMAAVQEKTVDFGVIIHEGRFIYKNLGLKSIVDLGQWWENFTSLPIPLGCIAIKRELYKQNFAIAATIQNMIKASIEYGFDNPEAGKNYIKLYAQELNDEVINQHINLYVNDFSKDIGAEGERAIRTFFNKAEEAGIISPSSQPLFAC